MPWPDWEDLNKMAFWQCVQTWLIKSDVAPGDAVRVLFEAQRIKKAKLPMELDKATMEFINWQLYGGPQPEWIEYAVGRCIA